MSRPSSRTATLLRALSGARHRDGSVTNGSRLARSDDRGHLPGHEDLDADEPLVAEELLAHGVAVDRAARREVVLDEDPARREQVDHLVQVAALRAVEEEESNGPRWGRTSCHIALISSARVPRASRAPPRTARGLSPRSRTSRPA